MLFYLIYMSKSVRLMRSPDLSVLLTAARDWNQVHHITGMLLYVEGNFTGKSEGRFIQVLEGGEATVRALFEKIRGDERHQNVTLLNEGAVKDRNFKTWTMGFERKRLVHYQAQEGSFDLSQAFLDPPQTGRFNTALPFLQSFYAMRKSK